MADAFTLKGTIDIDINSVIKDLDKLGYKVDGVGKKTDSLSNKFSKFGAKLGTVGASLSKRVTLPIAAASTASFKLASDMEESMNKVKVACGDGADEVVEFSKTTLKNFGIAKGTSLDMMSTFTDMGTGMGLTTNNANSMSMSLVGLAGDLASFKNVRVDVAQTALNGIYTGETESLKQLGIVMTEANLQEYALSKGMKKKIKDMSQAEKVQLRYNYVMDKTTNAHGDFSRTSDGASNQMRIFTESMKELGATLGQHLLPLITPIITKVNEWVQKFGSLDEETQKIILVSGGLIALLGPALLIIGKLIQSIVNIRKAFIAVKTAITAFNIKAKLMTVVTKAQTLAQGALNMVMSMNPIYLVVIALTALIGVLMYLWHTSDSFRTFIIEKWAKITEIFTQFNAFLTGVFQTDWTESFGALGNIFNAFFQNIENYWNAIKRIFNGIISFVKGVFTGNWELAWQGVQDIFGGIMDGLGALIKAPLNGIIGLINFCIDGLNKIQIPSIDVPFYGEVGGWGFGIPKMNYLENGGILTRPTMLNPFVMAGEKNKGASPQNEVVIPLDKLYQMIDKLANRPVYVELDGKVVMRGLAKYQDEFDSFNKLRFI